MSEEKVAQISYLFDIARKNAEVGGWESAISTLESDIKDLVQQ